MAPFAAAAAAGQQMLLLDIIYMKLFVLDFHISLY
jgi:hypothetical protein